MNIGPAFRRFGALWLFLVVLVAACSSSADVAAPESTTSTPPTTDGENTTTSPPSTASPATESADADGADDDDAQAPSVVERRGPADIADFAGLAGQIAFRSDGGAIFVVSPDGSNPVAISETIPGQRSQPTWSNDGSRVAWSSFGGDGAVVSIASTTGAERIDIASPTAAFFLSWSNDDAWLAGLGPAGTGVELFLAATTDGDVRRVGVGQPFYIDWTQDNALVAAISGATVADISTGQTPPSERDLETPLGAFLAPASVDSDRTLVATVNSFGGNDLTILSAADDDDVVASARGSMRFSPNPVDETIAVLVLDDDPDSQTIAYQVDTPPNLAAGSVSILGPATGTAEVLDIDDALAISWSPDGNTLAVLRFAPGGLEWLFVQGNTILPGDPFIGSAEFSRSYLPFADQYDRASTWWSPDSQAMVFSGTIDGESGIWVDLVDDESGAAKIADGDIAFWSPSQ